MNASTPLAATRLHASTPPAALLTVDHLKVSFRIGKNEISEALTNVSFTVPENTTVALVGESGSGKSVSAMSVLRLLPDNAIVDPASRIVFDGHDILVISSRALRAIRGKDIGVIFQEPMSSLNPVYTVGVQIAELLQLHKGLSRGEALARTAELLAEVGIPEPKARLKAYPHELSGGQQQRVMIAMAIACEPKLLIADEPTTALDVTVQKQILDLLARLKKERRMSLLFISHDLGLVGQIADRVVVMRNGEVREENDVARIFTAPADVYTKALLACRPRLDVRPKRLPVIKDFMEGRRESVDQADQRPPRGASGAPILVATNLKKEYRLKTGLFARKSISAVKDVSFSLSKGRTLGVVGESGSGKTTVGMMLMRLTEATAGEVLFDGVDFLALRARELMGFRRRMQIIFQNPYASLNPRFTIGQILVEPMKIHGIGSGDRDRFAKVIAMLDRVGLPRAAIHKYPHEFSGGQRQRIAIARCLTLNPEVLICDESVSALDVSVQAQVLNLLLDLQDEFGLAYIFISHDLAVVKYISDEIMVMSEGEVVETARADTIYERPQHPYTQRLLESIPKGFPGAVAA